MKEEIDEPILKYIYPLRNTNRYCEFEKLGQEEQSIEENLIKFKWRYVQRKERRYPAQTITNTDYANDITLLANTRAQAETLLHGLEPAAGGIGLHLNADKTKYMCFN